MKNVRLATALVLAMVFGAAAPASSSWECTYLGGGGGGNWFCSEGNEYYYVDCTSGPCVYHRS